MQHGIRRDGIHLLVAPAVGIDGTREGGLLVQDVVPLQHDGERLRAQEAVRQLGVPQQLVGVQRLVGIAALAEHVEVGREVGTPRERNLGVAAVREVPRCQVVRGLQPVLGTGEGGACIQRDAEPPVAEAERYRGVYVVGMRHITVRLCCAVLVDIAHAVGIAGIDGAGDVPAVQRVKPHGEAHAEVGVPVAVDVLRPCDASSRRLIIGHDVADAVGGQLPSGIGVEAPVPLVLGHLVSEAVGDDGGLAHHLEVG